MCLILCAIVSCDGLALRLWCLESAGIGYRFAVILCIITEDGWMDFRAHLVVKFCPHFCLQFFSKPIYHDTSHISLWMLLYITVSVFTVTQFFHFSIRVGAHSWKECYI